MSRQHPRILLSVLALVLSMLSCKIEQVTPTPTTPDNTPSPTARATVVTPAPASTQAEMALVIAGAVNVRTEPGGEVVGQIFAGQSVEVAACADGWCEIRTPVRGWVFEGCLSVETERKCEAK